MSRLPFDACLAAGRGLARILHRFFPKRRRATAINIALSFPDLSADEQAMRVKAVYANVGMTIAETAWLWFRSLEPIRDRFSVTGAQHLENALDSDRGVIILQAHFSTLEIVGGILGPRWSIGAVYDSPKNALAAEWLLSQRRRRLGPMIDNKNIRQMIRRLRKGGGVWYSPDQCVSAAQGGIHTQFFNQAVLTSNGTARMVQMTKATVIPMLPTRHNNGKSYHITFFPPMEFDDNDELSRTQAINDLFEKHVRHYPDQYLWLHKRFKPPPGEPNPYSP